MGSSAGGPAIASMMTQSGAAFLPAAVSGSRAWPGRFGAWPDTAVELRFRAPGRTGL